jgi:hypothetical protein
MKVPIKAKVAAPKPREGELKRLVPLTDRQKRVFAEQRKQTGGNYDSNPVGSHQVPDETSA